MTAAAFCSRCEGVGTVPMHTGATVTFVPCPRCAGAGVVRVARGGRWDDQGCYLDREAS